MMSEASKFDLNTSAGGRGFIANLFVTVLRRHDFTTYIKERLAADFACTLSKFVACAQAREADLHSDFDRVTAERDALQLRLNAADQRNDELESQLTYAVDVLNEVVKVSAMYEKPFEIATLAIGELSASAEPA